MEFKYSDDWMASSQQLLCSCACVCVLPPLLCLPSAAAAAAARRASETKRTRYETSVERKVPSDQLLLAVSFSAKLSALTEYGAIMCDFFFSDSCAACCSVIGAAAVAARRVYTQTEDET